MFKLRRRELVCVLLNILHALLFVFFSSSWCRSLAAACDTCTPWNVFCLTCHKTDVTKSIVEPTHEIMALIALRKLNLKTRMRSHPMGLHVWFSVRSFVFFYNVCVRTAKALARLRGRALSPEPSLFAYAISTIIS